MMLPAKLQQCSERLLPVTARSTVFPDRLLPASPSRRFSGVGAGTGRRIENVAGGFALDTNLSLASIFSSWGLAATPLLIAQRSPVCERSARPSASV